MARLFRTALNITWGLWFGGLVMLFIAVQSVFRTWADQHELAGLAASGIFQQFNRYRLILAACALLLTFVGWMGERSRAGLMLFTLFALATAAAVYSAGVMTPHLERLRLESLTHTPEFKRLHGLSMGVYLLETVLVFFAGIVLSCQRKLPGV